MKRIGKFYINTVDVMEDEVMHQVFAQLQFIPLRVENLAYSDRFEFIGISPMFEPLKKEFMAGEYNIEIIHNEDDDSISVKAVRG